MIKAGNRQQIGGSGDVSKPPLTVQNAAITTASVEIKTLTVSGKQVTLAVFRQLLEQQLILDDGTLAGQPWGVVNYHPDKCGSSLDHWHVVWQHGSELRRSAVLTRAGFKAFDSDEGDRFLASCVHDLATTGTCEFFNGKLPQAHLARDGSMRMDTGLGLSTELFLSEAGRLVLRAMADKATWRTSDLGETEALSQWARDRRRKAEAALSNAVASLAQEIDANRASTRQIYDAYQQRVIEEKKRRDRHVAVREELAGLPQLFIAV